MDSMNDHIISYYHTIMNQLPQIEWTIDNIRNLVETTPDFNIDAKYGHGLTLLCYASSWGHFDIVKYLVESGATVNTYDEFGYSPLFNALNCQHGDWLATANYLVDKGADPSLPLFPAINSGDIETIKYLLENGACTNVQGVAFDYQGMTAIEYARQYAQNGIDISNEIATLLEQHVDAKTKGVHD